MAIPGQVLEGLPPVDLATLDLLPDPAWLTPPDGTLAYFNVAWLRMAGSASRVLAASDFIALLHPEDRERRRDEWQRGLRSNAPFVSHVRMRYADGSYGWFLVRSLPVEEGGVPRGWFTTAVDVDAERRANDELVATQARELSIVNAIPQLIGITAADGSVISVNAAHCEYTGLTLEDMRGTGWMAIVHPDDVGALADSWRHAVATEQPYDTQYRLRRRDGTYRWFLNKATPVRDADGQVTAWIGTATDIDEQKRAEEALRVVVEASSAFAETLDAAVALQRLADIAARHMADWCGVYVRDDDGHLQPVAIAHHDPARVRYAREFLRRYPPRDDSATAQVAATGVALRVDDIPDVAYEAIEDLEERQAARALGVRAFLIVPLGVDDERYGALTLALSETDRRFNDADQQLALLLAQRAAIAVSHARLFERQRAVARTLQGAFLPPALPQSADVAFDAVYAAGTADLTIGGDWYDAFPSGDRVFALSVGDVAGRGLDAAVPMGKMRQTFRALAALATDPARALGVADGVLRNEHPDVFVTAIVASYDAATRRLRYANAGHPPPVVRASTGAMRRLESAGMPLGVAGSADLTERDETLAPGDLLVAFTDGLIEATHDIAEGEARLEAALAHPAFSFASAPAALLRAMLLAAVPGDDVAILTLRAGAGADWSFDANDGTASRRARRDFLARLRAEGIADGDALAYETVFGEIVGNAARYTPGPIDMALSCEDGRLVLGTLDRGPGFDWDPSLPANAMAETGRGLYLIGRLAESVRIERLGTYGTYLEVTLAR
jgi:PAS domain S-box-containing protein